MKLSLVLVSLMVCTGCASAPLTDEASNTASPPTSTRHNGPPFLDHDNAGVQIPARAGAILGAVVGIPVSILLAPITIPYSVATDSNLGPITPLYYSILAGGTIFGGIAWPFFGWW